jgi:two-component system sensor histidine kinase UhpB
VAMAPIEPSRFTDILERSEMLPLDVISVVGHDGIERARLRDGITVSGDDVRNSALFVQALRSATGNMRTDAQADGVPRYYSYRTIPGYGLVAAVGRAESDVMAEFVQRQRRYLAAAAIATVLIVGFAVLFLMALAGQRRGSATGLRNQARFMAAFDQAAVGISHSDPSGRYIEVNQRFCDILGYTEAELLAGNVGEIVGFAGDWPEGSDRERRLLATGARKALDWEKRCIRKDGSAVWCAITVSAVRDDQGRIEYFLSVVHDISPRKQAEEEFRAHGARLQRLSRQLMHAQEGERRRLGRELHDRIGANLSASVLSLEVLRANAGAQRAGSAARIDDCVQLLRETIAQVRDVLANLRPPALDEIGLVAAIAFHCRTVARRANLEIDVEGAEPSPRLPPETEISLFRIAQEALTNAVKHARATRITVRVTQQAGDVTLSIADNGQGFDADIGQSLSVSSLGLLTMRERAEAVNGTLVADSPPGGGARVIVVVARAPEPALASV